MRAHLATRPPGTGLASHDARCPRCPTGTRGGDVFMNAKLVSMLGLVLVTACGGGSSGPPALTLQKATTASGDGQTDSVLSTLPNPLRVRADRKSTRLNSSHSSIS